MGDDVIRLREVDENLAIAIAIGHLGAIPEGVVVILVIVDGRHERHSEVIKRIAAKAGLIKNGNGGRLVKGSLYGLAGRCLGAGDGASGQRRRILAIIDRNLWRCRKRQGF